jgi:hypothetical protein
MKFFILILLGIPSSSIGSIHPVYDAYDILGRGSAWVSAKDCNSYKQVRSMTGTLMRVDDRRVSRVRS